MTTLSGNSISQLRKLASGDRTGREDAFFVSQPITPGLPYNGYASESLAFGDFSDRLFADLSAGFGFGGMIHEVSSDYSPAAHSHPYNWFDAQTPEQYNPDQYDVGRHSVLATFVIDGRKVRVVVPEPFTYEEPPPVVGQLKFVAVPQIGPSTGINVNSPNFDGWVYPDGRTYYVQGWQFREAKRMFGQDPDLNQITVPALSSFVKAMPGPTTGVSRVAWQTPLRKHSHDACMAYFSGSKQFNASIQVGVHGSANSDQGMMHLGKKPASTNGWPKPYFGEITLTATSATLADGCSIGSSESSAARESYPSHNMLPAMIYIGRNDAEDQGGGTDSDKYTRIFTDGGQVWQINVDSLTREALEFAGGAQ